MIKEEKKHAITNHNERLVALTIKEHHKDNYKKIFEKLVKEKFDEIKELTHDDLTYYFKGNTARKIFGDFNNDIERFRKIRSAEMKLEETKSNLKEISGGRYKSEEQKLALENIKLLYESREAVIKLFNDYSSIVSEA